MDILRPTLFDINPYPDRRIRVVMSNGKVHYRKYNYNGPTLPHDKKYCPHCEEVKNIKEFTSSNRPYCRVCTNDATRKRYTSKKGRIANLRTHYGLTEEEYDLMLFRQGGVCAICGDPETVINWRSGQVQFLAVDHNHDTGDVRELICHRCNTVVGLLEEDRVLIKRVMKYLEKHDS